MPLLERGKQFAVTLRERGRSTRHASVGGVVRSCAAGGVTRWVTSELVAEVLGKCGVRDKKSGALPVGFMVCFTLALALFQQDSYDDVAKQLVGENPELSVSSPNKSSFTRASGRRLGPLVWETMFRELAGPLAAFGTPPPPSPRSAIRSPPAPSPRPPQKSSKRSPAASNQPPRPVHERQQPGEHLPEHRRRLVCQTLALTLGPTSPSNKGVILRQLQGFGVVA